MPSRPSHHTNSFAANNHEPANDSIECTLFQSDGTRCKKKCYNEKRYRSLQEHIRRAHSEHYIPKLPATEESVRAMMNSKAHSPIPASDSSPLQHGLSGWNDHLDDVDDWTDGLEGHGPDNSSYPTSSMFSPGGHYRRGSMLQTTNAAAALAQLHDSKPDGEWQGNQDAFGDPENEHDYMPNYFANEGSQEMFPEYRHNEMGPHMSNPPPERSFPGRAMSASFGRRGTRARKASMGENARKGKHERERSKDLKKRYSHDRQALSAEPHSRWNDLLDAAQSATEEESRDLTPIPQSPRTSMPPFQGPQSQNFQSFTTSPLQNTLLQQESTDEDQNAYQPPGLDPFPSVENYDPNSADQRFQTHTHQSSGDSAHSHPNMYPTYADHRNHASSSASNFHLQHDGISSPPGQHSRPQTHDSNHMNNAFARPHLNSNNSTHFPHPLNAAHFAQQQAAAQQQSSNYGQNQGPGPWLPHQQTYSASASGASSAHSSAHPHNGGSLVRDYSSTPIELFCANCKNHYAVAHCFACTECICGVCASCAEIIQSDSHSGRSHGCPKCSSITSMFKPINLDLKYPD